MATVAVAAEEEQCYEYRIYHATGGGQSSGTTKQEACNAWAGYVLSVPVANVGGKTLNSAVVGGTSNNTCTVTWSGIRIDNGNPYGPTSSSASIQTIEIDCPVDPCAESEGEKSLMSGQGALPAMSCRSAGAVSCQYEQVGIGVSASGAWVSDMRSTGQQCETPEEEGLGANCISGVHGVICLKKSEEGCGTFNGQDVCLGTGDPAGCGTYNGNVVCLGDSEIPEDQCLITGDGGAFCPDGAPGTPKDSEGNPLTPDSTVKGGNSTTYNYYGPGTLGGNEGGSGASGVDADGSAETGGSVGTFDADCEGDACYGSIPAEIVECADDVAACVAGHAASAVSQLLEHVPLLGFVASLGGSFAGGGQCPGATVELLDVEMDLTGSMCELLESNSGVIGALMYVFWSLAALRILLSSES